MIAANIRRAAVAGRFYPLDPEGLERVVRDHLAAAAPVVRPSPKVLIAPHAGYVYSGAIAGTAFATWMADASVVERVVVIGPAHYVELDGIAVSSAQGFATPLGVVRVDEPVIQGLLGAGAVCVADAAHEPEHSLEVELPFLQVLFPAFQLVPLLVGRATPQAVAAVLEAVWGGPETRLVVSSDLSHFLDYPSARQLDAATAAAIERLDAKALGPNSACGRVPIQGLLEVARRRRLEAQVLDLRNSGDTAGTRHRVVGYGAFAFREQPVGTKNG